MVIIDDTILAAAHLSEAELKIELAVLFYQQRRLSFGQACSLAGVGYFEFQKILAERKIDNGYTLDDLQSDLKTIEKLNSLRRDSHQ
jgi:predicted HTH domain antitoxin